MNLKQRLEQIKQLEAVETPFDVKRIFGELRMWGSQIYVRGDDQRDYVDLQEFQQALTWLVEQSGGKVTWTKGAKK